MPVTKISLLQLLHGSHPAFVSAYFKFMLVRKHFFTVETTGGFYA